MDTRLQFTVTLVESGFYVEAEILSGPNSKDIFIFENTGGTELGPYVGVVDLDQLIQYPKWEGTSVPTFGVHYLRHNKAFDTLPDSAAVEQWKGVVRHDVQAFIREVNNYEPEVTTFDLSP